MTALIEAEKRLFLGRRSITRLKELGALYKVLIGCRRSNFYYTVCNNIEAVSILNFDIPVNINFSFHRLIFLIYLLDVIYTYQKCLKKLRDLVDTSTLRFKSFKFHA